MWSSFNCQHGMSLLDSSSSSSQNLLSEDPISTNTSCCSLVAQAHRICDQYCIYTVLYIDPVFYSKELHAALSLRILKEEQNIQKTLLARSNQCLLVSI